MRTSKLLKIYLLITSFLLITKLVYPCAWYPSENNYTIFLSEYLLDKEFSPLFYTAEPWDDFWFSKKSTQSDNIDEWVNYFDNKLSESDIEELIYKSDSETFTRKSDRFLKKHILGKKAESFRKYMLYSLFVQPHTSYSYYYWDKPKQDVGAMKQLINEGTEKMLKEKDEFIKLRYAFQILKLMRQCEMYNDIVKFYNTYISENEAESIIRYWALDHKAGALAKLNRNAKSAYLFSKVFANCPSRRYSSFYSFKITSQQEWDKAMSSCQNSSEKLMLHFLRAVKPNSIAFEEMQQMSKLNGDLKYLEIIMTREINKIESNLLLYNIKEISFVRQRTNSLADHQKEAVRYTEKLLTFCDKILNKKDVENRDFWKLSKLYLYFLKGDYNKVESFAKLKHDFEIDGYNKLKNQIVLLTKLVQLKNITTEDENLFYTNFGYYPPLFKNLISNYFEYILTKNGNNKQYLCNNHISDLRMKPDLSIVNTIIDILNKKENSEFEKYVLVKFKTSGVELDKVRAGLLNDMNELKATIKFKDGDLTSAISIYEKLPEDYRNKEWRFMLNTNPFNMSIKDCIDCGKLTRAKHTKLSFAKLIRKIEGLTKTEPDNAMNFYLLGNAYYNMTYFGRSWNVLGYYRSGSSLGGFLDFSKSKYYYKKALESSKDDEMKAKCCFMLAKCRQNEFYLKYLNNKSWYPSYHKYNYDIVDIENEKQKYGYRRYFDKLKKDYSHTEYYKKAINECSLFEMFCVE